MLSFISAEGLPLGLNFVEILIHMFNLGILVTGLTLLLYKPVKKFMAEREEKYKAVEEFSERNKKESEVIKKQYNNMLEEARQNAVHISEEASATAMIQADEIISDAKQQAKDIVVKAKKEIAHEQVRAKEEMLFSVSELAVDIASKILEREVRIDDNDVVINSLLENWKESK